MMKKISILIIMLLSIATYGQRVKTINSYTSRTTPAITDRLPIQSSANVTYSIRLDTLGSYLLSDTNEVVRFTDTSTNIATQFDIITVCGELYDTVSEDYTLGTDYVLIDTLLKGTDQNVSISSNNGSITINSGLDGYYIFNATMTTYTTVAGTIDAKCFVADNEKTKIWNQQTHAGSDYQILKLNGILYLAAGEDVTVKLKYSEGATVSLLSININLTKL